MLHLRRLPSLVLWIAISSCTTTALMMAQEDKTAMNKTGAPSDTSSIQDLNRDIASLGQKVDKWNGSYVWWLVASLIIAAVSIGVAGRVVYAQYQTIHFAGMLSDKQSALDRAKDRERAVKDTAVAEDLKSKDVEIGRANAAAAMANEGAAKANEGARLAESHLAGANAQAKLAEQHANEADAKAESFRLDIATANESAAQANRVAEQERLARVRIEQILGGWRLSADGAKRLTEELKPFAGTEFDFFINPTESAFFNVLDKVLEDAKWKRLTPGGPITFSNKAVILYVSGLFAEIRVDSFEKSSPAIKALINGLSEQGITMKLNLVKEDAMPSTVLHIVVGRRE